jgi:nicotinate-nucleotide pyrophosphorylase (carboxylating)
MLDSETTDDCLKLIALALTEDVGAGNLTAGIDCTTDALVPRDATARAALVSRADGIVCGVEVARLAVRHFASRISLEVSVDDGELIQPKQIIATIEGPAHEILTMERTILNFICRLSGISSLTQTYVQQIAGTSAQVFDTRKTTPGWRRLEKHAVKCGGGQNHRMGLFDAVMIKDNHLAFFRSQVDDADETIPLAVRKVRQWITDNQTRVPNGNQTIIELEVDSLEQLKIGLSTPCDIILLDNMAPPMLLQAVEMRNRIAPQIELEASGGVNLASIRSIAETGIERISSGALTHSAINFDIGLDWNID